MGKTVVDDKPRRFPGVLRPVGAVLPPLVRPAFRAAGQTVGQLIADWPAIVGTSVAEASTPRRFAAGTLTLGCSGPVAMELQHLAAMLMERINRHFGRPLVQRLRFVQEAVPTRAGTAVPRAEERPPVEIEGFAPGPLRDALGRLGARVAGEGA